MGEAAYVAGALSALGGSAHDAALTSLRAMLERASSEPEYTAPICLKTPRASAWGHHAHRLNRRRDANDPRNAVHECAPTAASWVGRTPLTPVQLELFSRPNLAALYDGLMSTTVWIAKRYERVFVGHVDTEPSDRARPGPSECATCGRQSRSSESNSFSAHCGHTMYVRSSSSR